MRSYSDISIGDSGYSYSVKIDKNAEGIDKNAEGSFILEFKEK